MKRTLAAIVASLWFLGVDQQAIAHGGLADEPPRAAEHVERLPDHVRRNVAAHERACGDEPAAAHYFSISIEASGFRFRAQHFEDFACARRSAVCRPDGCLHEVFLEDSKRQQLVFSIYARDVKLTNEGGVAGLEVSQPSACWREVLRPDSARSEP